MNVPGIERAASLLAEAGRVVVFSGAGISAESGIATFRDAGGLWERHSIEDVATLEGFRRNPTLVWEFYESRRRQVAAAMPNAGHFAIAALARLVPEFTVITQNVDGLHQRAGSDPVLEVHGSLWRARCAGGCGVSRDPFATPLSEIPPRCECGDFFRPSVVWFGELLPEDVWTASMNAATRADVALVVGTSGAVWPAAGIPLATRERGGVAIEVNPESTELTDHVDLTLRGASGVILPKLVAQLQVCRGAKSRPAGAERV